MSRSLIVRFVLAGLVPLLAASALLFVQQKSAARTQAEQNAHNRAATVAGDLGREFQSWRTELLVAANNPVLRQWYEQPSQDNALRGEVDRALLQLNTLNPDLIDEACFVSARGPELARQVEGVAAPLSDSVGRRERQPFFRATFTVSGGQVHQNAPYISPDSKRWVISNSTPIIVAGRKVALLHFESNLDAIRTRLAADSGNGTALRVVDSRTATTIADGRSTQPILGQPLAKSSASRCRRVGSTPASPSRHRPATTTTGRSRWRWRRPPPINASLLLRLAAWSRWCVRPWSSSPAVRPGRS